MNNNSAQAVPEGEQATIAGLDAANGHLSTLLDDSVLMLKQLRQMVDDLHERWSNGGKPERGEFELLDRVDDWLSCRPDSMVTATAPAQEPDYRVDDEAQLQSAIEVMNDVLADIGDWEDQALADAVRNSKRDLEAMAQSIRFMADEPSQPGTLTELLRQGFAVLMAKAYSDEWFDDLDSIDGLYEFLVAEGERIPDDTTIGGTIEAIIDALREKGQQS